MNSNHPPGHGKALLAQTLLAILLPCQTAGLSYAVFTSWPARGGSQGAVSDTANLPLTETRLLLLVMLCGALGASLHALYSFCDYTGNRRFQMSWFFWYIGRVPVGMSVATVLYLALRGGFTGFSGGINDLNLYGIAGIASLTGMFSRQAVTKLSEIATTIFTKLPPQPDALQHPKPTLLAIRPPTVEVGSGEVRLAIEGRDFIPGLHVVVNRMQCEASWKSATEAEVVLAAQFTDKADTLTISLRNPDPSPGESDKRELAVVAAVK
jgi:hypothetical protein